MVPLKLRTESKRKEDDDQMMEVPALYHGTLDRVKADFTTMTRMMKFTDLV